MPLFELPRDIALGDAIVDGGASLVDPEPVNENLLAIQRFINGNLDVGNLCGNLVAAAMMACARSVGVMFIDVDTRESSYSSARVLFKAPQAMTILEVGITRASTSFDGETPFQGQLQVGGATKVLLTSPDSTAVPRSYRVTEIADPAIASAAEVDLIVSAGSVRGLTIIFSTAVT